MAYNSKNNHFAYRYGYCVNDKCEKSKKDNKGKPIIQQVASHKQFICEMCEKPLHECPPPKKTGLNWKLIGIIAAAVAVLCGGGFGIWKLLGSGPDIAGIKLDPKKLELVIGETPRAVVTASVVDKDGNEIKDAKVTYDWKIKDTNIATVTQGGEVTAVKKGKTVIRVKIEGDDKLRATCQVEVKEKQDTVYVESITASNVTMKVGETAPIACSVVPEENDESISATSSDESVVTITESGDLTALKEGTAIVTLRTSLSNKQTTFQVTVAKAETGPVRGGDPVDKVDPKARWKGTVSLGYGSYSGDLLGKPNGKPDGAGVLTFTKSYQLPNGTMAEKGDVLDGVFRNGYIASGTLTRTNGQVEKVR